MLLAFLLTLVLLLAGPVLLLASGAVPTAVDWSRLDRSPVGLAPDAAATPEAVVQVYAARVLSWRGAFGVHPWFAVKPAGARSYTVYEVIGWRAYRGLSVVSVSHRDPDGRWFGAQPTLLGELRGLLDAPLPIEQDGEVARDQGGVRSGIGGLGRIEPGDPVEAEAREGVDDVS